MITHRLCVYYFPSFHLRVFHKRFGLLPITKFRMKINSNEWCEMKHILKNSNPTKIHKSYYKLGVIGKQVKKYTSIVCTLFNMSSSLFTSFYCSLTLAYYLQHLFIIFLSFEFITVLNIFVTWNVEEVYKIDEIICVVF